MVHIKDDQHIEYNIVYKGGIKQTWNLKKKNPLHLISPHHKI